MNRFIEGGRLTDHHKYKINTEQTLNRLNQIAKEKVEVNTMKISYQQVSNEFIDIIEYLESEWGDESVCYVKDILKYALECVEKVQEIEDRKAITNYIRNKVNG